MSEQYSKVEIVTPPLDAERWGALIFKALFNVALMTLLLWWLVATWTPELGLTYWELVLPVVVVRFLFGHGGVSARTLDK